MHFQQVFAIALAFSSSRGASVLPTPSGPLVTIMPPLGPFSNKVVVEQDALGPTGEWHVRLIRPNTLMPHVYFPPVSTPETLQSTLEQAWALYSQFHGAPFLTRATESTSPLPRSALPPLRRTYSMTQTPPRRE